MKINEKYKSLWTSDTRYFIVTGGRGSSKSFSVNVFLSQLLYQQWHKVLFTRYTLTAASKSIIPEFIEKLAIQNIESHYKVTNTELTNKHTDSSIIFSGIKTSSGNQTANLKSLQGVSTWVLDEAEELIDESVFDTIDLSIRESKVQNRVIIILNPATKEHWIYKKFFEDRGIEAGFNGVKDDVTYIHTTYLDNKENLSESFLNSLERMKQNRPEKYNHVVLGGWLNKAEGVIFNNWTIGDYVSSDKEVGGQDFGFTVDPTTLVKCNVNISKKTIHIKQLIYETNLTTSDIALMNKRYFDKGLIYADSAEPRLIQELSDAGVNVLGVRKGAGSIVEGISLMQDYAIIIDPSSIETIKEFNNYAWSKNKIAPIDRFNHSIDAIRYAVTSYLRHPNSGTYYY